MKYLHILSAILISLAGSLFAQENLEVKHFSEPINPDKFIILPGEQLDVTFLHSKIDPLNLKVNSEGKIVDRDLGIIELNGLTLTDARKKLSSRLNDLFKNSEIEISVSHPRETSISIVGAVKKPGTYSSYNSNRVSDIIMMAEGISAEGSTRNILFRNGSHTSKVDLDRSTYLGEREFDPYLYEGSEIYIPNRSEDIVNITGEVNNPRTVELTDGDDVNLIIDLAGGTRSFADISNTKVIRNNQEVKSDKLEAGDIIVVPVKERFANRDVSIFGEINSPGYYPYKNGMTLSDLLSSGSGLRSEANSKSMTLFRKSVSDFDGRVSEVSYPIIIQNLNLPETQNFKLAAGDSLYVAKKIGFVKVSGAVMSPGYYPYIESKKVSEYISAAGGYTPKADKAQVQLFNPSGKITISISAESIAPDGSEIIVLEKELKSEQ